ncbi:GNAT family N-acetyltransferase [Sutcliffiella horikoshii]|uniref:GNAT family N-acetyltransferase n=1 Tax=Sutcliffiella horikoshii TaxID=79883 RepID=A0AA95B5M8_9BACI|nr:GNAT family N-acetyltransferase [Sutcliffiella horikoshii]TYS58420.1 GNAT family N-acetyltransferase [Sutcliffiella horikoshii]
MNKFNIVKNKQEYWLVDQIKKEDISTELYIRELTDILGNWSRLEIGYLSLLMDEQYESWLLERNFGKISSIVEYTRDLEEVQNTDNQMVSHSLAEGLMDDQKYAELYELCRSGSANKNTKQPIAQVMSSLENELGPEWRKHCYYFLKDGAFAGISIPHIEMGTKNEGRLFYFGVVPDLRGQGIGAQIHQVSMQLLKNFQATYYVGSTDVNNTNMIKIFEKNGCQLRDKKGIYKIVR